MTLIDYGLTHDQSQFITEIQIPLNPDCPGIIALMDPAFCNQTTDRFRLLMVPSGPFLPFAWNRSLRSQINALVSFSSLWKNSRTKSLESLKSLAKVGRLFTFSRRYRSVISQVTVLFQFFRNSTIFPAFPEFHIFHFFPISPVLSSRGSHIWQCGCG